MTNPPRIPFGDETDVRVVGDGPALYVARNDDRCPDCRVERGEYHRGGCDVEQCPKCRRQRIGCGCGVEQ